MEKQNADQYLYQDGKWIKAGKTLAVVSDVPGPTPSGKKETKRNIYLIPDNLGIGYVPNFSSTKDVYNTAEFLDTPLFDTYSFDFENHNYWWAYGNRPISQNYIYLKRQNTCSGNYINQREFKKCRKKYTNEITAIPTWRTLLEEIISPDFIQYIDTSNLTRVSKDKGFNGNNRISYNLLVSLPLYTNGGQLANKEACLHEFSRHKLNVRRKYRTACDDGHFPIDGLNREKISTGQSQGSIYIVKDVVSFDRSEDEGKQYIPGEIISRFGVSAFGVIYYESDFEDDAGTVLDGNYSYRLYIVIQNNKTVSYATDTDYLDC